MSHVSIYRKKNGWSVIVNKSVLEPSEEFVFEDLPAHDKTGAVVVEVPDDPPWMVEFSKDTSGFGKGKKDA